MNIAIILVILLVGVVVTYCSGNRFASKVAMLFSIAAFVFSVALLLQYLAGGNISFSTSWINKPSISFSLNADGLGMVMLMMTTIALPLILLSSVSEKLKNEKTFYSLALLTAFAIVGVFLSSNALLYYVFWEMSLVPIYFIIIYWGHGSVEKRKNATLIFFIYTFAGSMFMLAALIYLYTKVGSFELLDLYNANLSPKEQLWIFLAFFLAYAIKIPIFPFHTWQADVYEKAPTVGTMLLAGLMSKMGLYSVIRWQLPIVPDAVKEMRTIVLILCIVGVIYGSVVALKQTNLKRLFAYASLAHVSLIAAGIYTLNFDGLEGAVFLIIAHCFGIVGLFFAAEIINRRCNTHLIKELGGIRSMASRFNMGFFLMILASIAIPLSFNFLGEFTIMYGLYQVNIWYTIFIGTSMFLGAFFMLRMYQQIMLGEPKKYTTFIDLTCSESIVFAIVAAIILFFGVYATPIVDMVESSLRQIVDYIN